MNSPAPSLSLSDLELSSPAGSDGSWIHVPNGSNNEDWDSLLNAARESTALLTEAELKASLARTNTTLQTLSVVAALPDSGARLRARGTAIEEELAKRAAAVDDLTSAIDGMNMGPRTTTKHPVPAGAHASKPRSTSSTSLDPRRLVPKKQGRSRVQTAARASVLSLTAGVQAPNRTTNATLRRFRTRFGGTDYVLTDPNAQPAQVTVAEASNVAPARSAEDLEALKDGQEADQLSSRGRLQILGHRQGREVAAAAAAILAQQAAEAAEADESKKHEGGDGDRVVFGRSEASVPIGARPTLGTTGRGYMRKLNPDQVALMNSLMPPSLDEMDITEKQHQARVKKEAEQKRLEGGGNESVEVEGDGSVIEKPSEGAMPFMLSQLTPGTVVMDMAQMGELLAPGVPDESLDDESVTTSDSESVASSVEGEAGRRKFKRHEDVYNAVWEEHLGAPIVDNNQSGGEPDTP